MPALHALVVGVSDYPHLPGGSDPRGHGYGMRQLTATASTAAAVLAHLDAIADRLALPIGSRRVLLSPSPAELERDPSLGAGVPATRENLREAALAWREECASDPENIALFYFAGHGVQRTRKDWALLLHDFNDQPGNPLYNAVDVNDLFSGMAPTVDDHPRMARTQLWFVDACRGFPKDFDRFETLQASTVFGTGLSDADNRCAPVYCGALPGKSAYAIVGEQTIFGRALIECLGDTGSEQPLGSSQWVVSVGSLLRAMQAVVKDINQQEGSDQEVWDGGQTPRPDTVLVRLGCVPKVPVRLELVPAAGNVVLRFERRSDGSPVTVPIPLHPNPFADRWPAGVYTVEAQPPVHSELDGELLVRPPRFPWKGIVP